MHWQTANRKVIQSDWASRECATLFEVLDAPRRLYLAEFKRSFAEHPNSHLEPALRMSDGRLAVEGYFATPCRADMILRDSGKSVMVDSPARVSMKQLETRVNGTDFIIRPLLWDYAAFELIGVRADTEWAGLTAWFSKWFDIDDTNELNEEGFYGVTHFLSDPEPIPAGQRVIIDFGSAPIQAFSELVECLTRTGAERIEVG
jgi:hypothetical protein